MSPGHRASLAQQILTNEAWEEAFATIERGLTAQWATTTPPAAQLRERLYERLQALKDVKGQLESFLATGALPKRNP